MTKLLSRELTEVTLYPDHSAPRLLQPAGKICQEIVSTDEKNGGASYTFYRTVSELQQPQLGFVHFGFS